MPLVKIFLNIFMFLGFCWQRCVLRTSFILAVLLFTEFAPFLILIMSSHGTVLFVILGVCIPGVMYIRTFDHVGIVKKSMIIVIAMLFIVYMVVNIGNAIRRITQKIST